MDRIWLKHYPPGVPAEVEYRQYRSIGAVRDQDGDLPRPPGLYQHGQDDQLRGPRAPVAAFGAWLQGSGTGKGRAVAVMMPNCLQYRMRLRHPACRSWSTSTAQSRAARAPAEGLRFRGYRILENLAHVLQQVMRGTRGTSIAALGDRWGEGSIVNFILRCGKKCFPGLRSRHDPLQCHDPGGERLDLARRRRSQTLRFCSTGRRTVQGRVPTATSR